MRPVVPKAALGPLGAMMAAGLDHRASRVTLTNVTKANKEVVTAWTDADEGPLPCHLQTAGSRIAELAAARGVKAQYTLRFRRQDEATIGERFVVTGVERGTAWERTVEVTADLTFTGKVMRLYAVADPGVSR